MRITDSNRLPTFSRVIVAACAAVLLVATPIAASADRQGAPLTQRAPVGEPAPASARGGPLPAQPAADPPPPVAWESYSVEVYGRLVKRTGKIATLLPLVATTETPVAEGTKAVLFRRLEDPQSESPARWVEIAKVTLKAIESSGHMQLTIDAEHQPPAGGKGKQQSYFVKGARLKLAVE